MTCGGSRKSLFIRLEGMLYLQQRCQHCAEMAIHCTSLQHPALLPILQLNFAEYCETCTKAIAHRSHEVYTEAEVVLFYCIAGTS